MPRPGLAFLTAAFAIAALPTGAAAQTPSPKPPVVAIATPGTIVDQPKRSATMRVFDGQRRHNYSGLIGIELRGFTSQEDDPKKSYALETRTLAGKERRVSLLGMPSDDDWVLIASYRDESLLRNYVAYSAARWAGRYASRTQLVELIVNGRYEGVYLLAEQLKLNTGRLAVDATDVSGGYLLEMISARRTAGQSYFTTTVQNRPVVYADPNRKSLPYGRAFWIRDYVRRFERALYSERFADPQLGYRRYLDVDAAVDFLLLNELFRNADTFRNSTYMYKSVGGKLVLGPLWDFDHALGNDGAEDNLLAGWEYGASPWAARLYADPGFRSQMATRWRELRRQGLRQHIMLTIDLGARQLAGAEQRNFSRWPVFETGAARPRDPRTGEPPASYAQAVDYLKWWLRGRINWIDSNIGGLQPDERGA